MQNRKCACCGNDTLLPDQKFYDICNICGWEDDPIQNDDPNYSGGANHISLNVAKQAFAEGQPLEPLIQAAIQRWKQRRVAEAALQEDELDADEEKSAVPEREPAFV